MGRRAIVIVLAVCSGHLHGELLPIKTYTTADGLASDRIHNILADSRGFLWFCTPEGLSRFDGYRFVNYAVDEGLPHRAVYTVLETRAGEFFIGTARGLSKITKPAKFANYIVNSTPAKNAVIALRETRAGKLWLATPREVFEWTGPQSFRQIPQRPGPILIQDVIEDAHGDLWVATSNDLWVYGVNGYSQRFTQNDGLPGAWVETLLLDSKGRLWAGVRGGLAMLVRGADGHWSLAHVYTERSGLVGSGVTALAEASDGTLWIAMNAGISRMRTTAAGQPVFDNLTRAQGLSDREITALAEDQAGNMWAGTAGAGVMKIARLGFTTYREPDGLASDLVYTVFENRGGALVAVTNGVGHARRTVDIFDGRRFHAVPSGPFGADASWGWNQVLLQSRTGEWWGATNQGLCRFGATTFVRSHETRSCYSYGIVFRTFEDSRGGIWASAFSEPIERGDRLMRWDPVTKVLTNFPALKFPGQHFVNGYTDDMVTAFGEDRHSNIWMGLYNGGLYRYDGREFRRFDQSDGVPAGSIFAILADERGLWIGSSSGGLARIEDTGALHPRIRVYNTAHGLASNTIYCLTEDYQGRIYAGTGKGVDRLDPRNGNVRHFTSADGLAHGELMSAVRDRFGSLWFATKQGLSKLDPGADPVPVKPRVLITDLRVGGASYPVSQLGESHVSKLELKPSHNQLQVDFVGLDYEPGDIVRYSFKLDGADKEWSPPRTQRAVNYASLSGGTYRFLVKAVTSEAVESAEPAEVDFVVLPPLWQRWWFVSGALMLVAALVLAAHRYRVAQMVNLERMRTSIATDLHDDIGAGLSQIAILSEVARVKDNGHGLDEPLERVVTLARELVDSMGDIVWSIRSEPQGMDSMLRHMREFAIDVLASQGIAFELRAPENAGSLHFSPQIRRQLYLMFKECIHNAARHSFCSGVVADLKYVNREVLLTVEDNGIGLASNGKPMRSGGGTGIDGMRRRAESLRGRVELIATPGRGCRVEIHLPARRGTLARERS